MGSPNSMRLDLARFLPGLPASLRNLVYGSGGEDVGLPMDVGGERDPRLGQPDALDNLLNFVQQRKAAEGSVLDRAGQGAQKVRELGQPPPQNAAPAQSIQELQRRIDRMGIPAAR